MTSFSRIVYTLAALAIATAVMAGSAVITASYANSHAQAGIKRAWVAVLCDPTVPHSQSLMHRNFILEHDVHTSPCPTPSRKVGHP